MGNPSHATSHDQDAPILTPARLRRSGRAGADDDQGAVHRAGARQRRDVHPPALRALLRGEPRDLAPAVRAHAGTLAALRQREVPARARHAVHGPRARAALRGREPIHADADRLPRAPGQRLRAVVRLLRLPAPARVPDHGDHPRRQDARVPARARHLPRHRRPRADAHRPRVRRCAGPLRRVRAHGGDAGVGDPRRARAASGASPATSARWRASSGSPSSSD